ncbi:MAG: transglycosylase domain-containing protein [Candidatus Gracilibacteria bacterium]|nr:transglycosylase domain-containing protein [Candidatus Gracilibacteria bacterium]
MKKKKIIKISIITILSIITIIYLSTYIVNPNIDKIPYSSNIYDSNNIKIGEIITANKYRHEKLEIKEIPEFTKNAIIDIEDKGFYKNNGIDITAIFRAIINNISTNQIIEGGSTISTQVIRNNYWLNEKRTFFKKIKEFYLSLALNKHYPKDEILRNYLGNIYFGYLNYGLKSSSNYYFDKNPKDLTKAEQIALISLPKNPIKYDPYKNKQEFKKRFEIVLNSLLNDKIITKEEYDSIKNEKFVFNENHENKLPYVIDYIKNSKDIKLTSKIETTIDYNLTKKIEETSKNSIIPLIWKNVKDYSVIIIDRNTKEIKTMIGGINYYAKEGQVNMITSPRQVGSTIKPFTYVLAFKNFGYTPETTILDLPTQFQTNLGYAYNPKNYSLDYKGEVTIAEALSQSINIPALKVAEKVGVGNLLNFLRQLGITSLTKDQDYYGLALTLGVGEISLYELTRAFTIFAYDGNFCDLKIISHHELESKSTKDHNNFNDSGSSPEGQDVCKQIIEKKYTDMISYILTNRYFKLNEFPINGNLDFENKKVFLKTGTSRNFKDNWTVGFTNNYIIGVWAGNKDGSEMKGVSGASGAGEIFKNIVDYLEKEQNTSETIKIEKNKKNYLEITSPLSNSIYKIDQTKPIETQKIKLDFSTDLNYSSYKWFINNNEIKDNFINIESGQKEIKIQLYDNNSKLIKEETNYIQILEK